ncbi:MAG: PorT family protein [Prevotella sp.]|nr:PorT family protein [Prevotella sp.]
MKKLLILVMTAMTTMTASAQIEDGNWYITPKAGVSVADMTSALFDSKQAGVDYNADLKPFVSFTAGVDFEYAMADQLGLAFGLSYARQGCKTKDDQFKIKLDYLNIPITFNFYPIPNCGLAIKAGVQVGFTMRKRMTLNGVEYNADNARAWWVNRWTGRAFPVAVENELSRKFNKVDCSIPLAVSYEYKSFQLEARYNLGLTKVMKEDPESSKHSVFLFTLGYKINLDND